MPAEEAMASAVDPPVAAHHGDVEAHAPQSAHGRRGLGPHAVRYRHEPHHVPVAADDERRQSLNRQAIHLFVERLGQVVGPSHGDRVAVDQGGGSGAGLDRVAGRRGDVDAPVPGAFDDGVRERMLRAGFRSRGRGQHLIGREPSQRNHLGQTHRALGDRAGLVQQHDVGCVGRLEDLASLEQDAELGGAAGPRHDGGGRRQTQGARARDQQDRHRVQQRLSRLGVGDGEPADERGQSDHHHDRDEDRGHAVGEPLDGRLRPLGRSEEAHDLRELRVRADLRDEHDQPAVAVDRRADDLAARAPRPRAPTRR